MAQMSRESDQFSDNFSCWGALHVVDLEPCLDAAGRFPWQQAGSPDAAERHVAERFRHLSAETDWTSEEMLIFLPREMIRMRAYLEERVRRIRAATAKSSAETCQSNSYQAAICKGKQYLLRRWEHQIVSLLDEAVKCHAEALDLQHRPIPAGEAVS